MNGLHFYAGPTDNQQANKWSCKMWNWLKGKKSYILAIGAAVSAVGAFAAGQISLAEMFAALFGAGGLVTLRSGVTGEVEKLMSKAQFDRAQE